MKIYLDSDYVCHLSNDGTMQEVETDVFDGKLDEYIKGYRYIPDGQAWTRSDGAVFHGVMVAPAIDYMTIMINVACSYLNDDQAESVTILFPEWKAGVQYRKEDKDKGIPADRVQYGGLLYRCIQSHISQSDWTPDITSALWVRTSTEEWPEWVQPTGAHDAYPLGAKVSHNGKHWINTGKEGNEFEPGVWGWDEVTE